MSPGRVSLVAACSLVLGPWGAAIGIAALVVAAVRPSRPEPFPTRLVLIVLLLELRSGRSVLAALQTVSRRIHGFPELARVARVASVSGPAAALESAGPEMRPILGHLVRAQRSGAPLEATIRRLLDENLADERADNLARARSLPVRLMLPVTLLMLPGLVLLLYAPSLLRVFDDLTGALF